MDTEVELYNLDSEQHFYLSASSICRRRPGSAARWHLLEILIISRIAILENLEIFSDNVGIVLQEKTDQVQCVHYIISCALCRIHLVKILILS